MGEVRSDTFNPIIIKPRTFFTLSFLFALGLTGCSVELNEPENAGKVDEGFHTSENVATQRVQSTQDVEACSGVPIPGAELLVEGVTGVPTNGSMELPGLTAVCLKIESNTTSGSVSVDEHIVFESPDLNDQDLVMHRMVEGLLPEQHTVTADIASTPQEHYIKVTAYYPIAELANTPEISSVDEALLVGQAYIYSRSLDELSKKWIGARAVRATQLIGFSGRDQLS